MHTDPLVSAIVHTCAETPAAAIGEACAILGRETGPAAAVLPRLTGMLSKESLVRLNKGLKARTATSGELALALRATHAGVEAGRSDPNVQLVWTGPDTPAASPRETLPQILEMLGRARRSILLVTFAAFKVRQIMEALQSAHQRGVTVTVVVESAENSAGQLTHDAGRAFPKSLIEAGCLWFWPLAKRPLNAKLMPGKLHAKCLVIDDAEVLVSSANLTDDAMLRNIEVGIRCCGGAVAAEVSDKFRSLMRTGQLRLVEK